MATGINHVYDDFEPASEWAREEAFDTLVVHLPGFGKDQLKVQVTSSHKLRVLGEGLVGHGNKWQRFRKEFPIPSNCDIDEITAKFESGVLYVKLPKAIALEKAQKPPPTQAQKPPTTEAQKPPPTQAQKPPTTEAQKPPPTQAQKPPTTEAQKPPATVAQKPPTTEAQKPPTTEAQKPPTTEAQKPPTTVAQKPPTTERQKPPTTEAQKPQTTEAPKPQTPMSSSDHQQVPSKGPVDHKQKQTNGHSEKQKAAEPSNAAAQKALEKEKRAATDHGLTKENIKSTENHGGKEVDDPIKGAIYDEQEDGVDKCYYRPPQGYSYRQFVDGLVRDQLKQPRRLVKVALAFLFILVLGLYVKNAINSIEGFKRQEL